MIKTLDNGDVILEANILKIFPTIQKGGGFEVKKIKVEFPSSNEQYPHRILIEQSGNRIQLVDGLEEGKKYKFYIDFRTNDWQDTAFGTITAWKIEPSGDGNDENNLPF